VAGHWPDAPVIRRDPARARALLAEAGRPALTLRLTLLNQPEFQTMALVARAQLAEIGVELVLDVRDGGTYWSSGKGDAGRDLDLVLMRFNGKLDPNFDTQWFTSSQAGVWNWSRWRSPEFDRLNAEAAGTLDPAARAALIVRLQQLMAESYAFIWLTYDVDLFASKSWLQPAIMPTGSDWQFAQFAPA
jgi:peptide/nickel transport system substrate-binding protein